MTSKERVKKAFKHEEADRIPIWTWVDRNIRREILGKPVGIDSCIERMQVNKKGCGEERKRFIIDNTQEMIELATKLGMDMIDVGHHSLSAKIAVIVDNTSIINANIFDVTIEEIKKNRWRISNPEGFWSIVEYVPANRVEYVVNDCIKEGGTSEFERYIEYLEARVTPSLTDETREGLEGTRLALESEEGKKLFVLGYADVVGHPISMLFYPLFLEAMITRPDLVERYIHVTTEGVMPVLHAQLEMGVDGVLGAIDFCYKNGPVFSPDFFRRFYVPHLKRIVKECHQYRVPYIKHLDGNTKLLLNMLVEEVGIDGYHAIEPQAGMDIGELKKEYGDRITLLGNVDCGYTLTFGTTKEVTEEVKDIIKKASFGGGHILSTSNAIHSRVPIENFLAMIEATKKFGRYPSL